jgi:predicted metalloprotease
MRWKGRRKSKNVEDRRGKTTGRVLGGGVGTIVIILAIYFLGGDPTDLLDTVQLDNRGTTTSYQGTAEENELADFVSVVLAETEDVWAKLFRERGTTYEYPKLVIYTAAFNRRADFRVLQPDRFTVPVITNSILI